MTGAAIYERLWDFFLRFCTALRFLTVLPISCRAEEDGKRFKQAVPFFPVVGAGIGLLAVGLHFFLVNLLPQPVFSCVLIVFFASVSNCLHLDGVADSGDGLLSSRSPERSLEIMKDSRVGAMGVSVLILLLLGKYAALTSISSEKLPLALFFIPFAGRVALVVAMGTTQYARREGGVGALFFSAENKKQGVLWGVLFSVVLCFIFGGQGLFMVLCMLAALLALNWKSSKQLGGATGDILGAQCELAELMMAVCFSTLPF